MKLMTLVPAFKVRFLPDLLAGLERQTVKADAVIVSDDSPGGDFLQALQSPPLAERAAALRLQVLPGPRQGAYANVRHLVTLWGGRSEFVHLLLDDDLIYPEFYERHQALHAAGGFRATVSLRWTADAAGQPLQRGHLPPAVVASAHKRLSVDAAMAFATSVGHCVNWFGEFSNMVLRADHVPFVTAPQIAGVPVIGLEDLATVLGASLLGPVGLLNEHLGAFRTSPQQATQDVQGAVMKLSTCAWVPLALAARRAAVLDDAAVQRCVRTMGGVALARYAHDPALAVYTGHLAALSRGDRSAEEPLLQAWQAHAASQVPFAVPGAASATPAGTLPAQPATRIPS